MRYLAISASVKIEKKNIFFEKNFKNENLKIFMQKFLTKFFFNFLKKSAT